MSDKSISRKVFNDLLKTENALIQEKDFYYFLRGEGNIVTIRQEEKKHLPKKIEIAKKTASLLSHIPSILFIGISGSIAAGNANENADIDFFIITSHNTLWVSRLFSVILLSLINVRRKRGVKTAPNKVCLNSFIGISKLEYFSSSKDIYTARELAQLYPLINRNKSYEKLLEKNNWYLTFLPNASPYENDVLISSYKFFEFIMKILNPFCAFSQQLYMKRHQTKEIIENELIMLHPNDYKKEILKRFHKKLMEYDLLTKE